MESVFILTLLSVAGVVLGTKSDKDSNFQDGIIIPYMVYLQSRPEPCVGSLIDPRWVLTAAHCPLPTEIRLGVYQPSIKHYKEQIMNYSLIIPHPEFDAKSLKNDLILIKLSKPAVLDMYVGTIAFALEPTTFNESCFIPTWAWNEYKSFSVPDTLTWTNQHSHSHSECWNMLQQKQEAASINIMCTGKELNIISKIKEVSAAPAICSGRLHGILSWAKAGVTLGNEGFFTEIHPYARWIMKVLSSY